MSKVVRDTGWLWSAAEEELTYPMLSAFAASWQACPPLHELVAAYLGYESKKARSTDDQMVELMAMFPTGAVG